MRGKMKLKHLNTKFLPIFNGRIIKFSNILSGRKIERKLSNAFLMNNTFGGKLQADPKPMELLKWLSFLTNMTQTRKNLTRYRRGVEI